MTLRRCTALMIAVAGVLAAPAAEACDCGGTGPPCVSVPRTPVLFAGRVTGITELVIPYKTGPDKTGKNDFVSRYKSVRFDVEESFQGQQQKSVEVTTGQGDGDCGFPFRTGERYLVYARDLPQTGRLYTSSCTRTRPMSEARPDLDFLRRRGDPVRGAGLEGTILELGRDSKNNDTPTLGMMKDVRVVVEGGGRKWEATTDDQGWFRVWGLPAGEYAVHAVLPKRFVPEATTRTVRITPAACGWVHMLATPYAFPQPR